MKSQNPELKEVYQLIIDQMKAVKNAEPGDDLDNEMKRGASLSQMGETIAELADKEIRYFAATGLPVNGGGIVVDSMTKQLEKSRSKGLLTDEFNR